MPGKILNNNRQFFHPTKHQLLPSGLFDYDNGFLFMLKSES